jgi:hypothetical protein
VREGLDDDEETSEEGEGLTRRVLGEEGEQGLAGVVTEAEGVASVALVAQRVEEDLRSVQCVDVSTKGAGSGTCGACSAWT